MDSPKKVFQGPRRLVPTPPAPKPPLIKQLPAAVEPAPEPEPAPRKRKKAEPAEPEPS